MLSSSLLAFCYPKIFNSTHELSLLDAQYVIPVALIQLQELTDTIVGAYTYINTFRQLWYRGNVLLALYTAQYRIIYRIVYFNVFTSICRSTALKVQGLVDTLFTTGNISKYDRLCSHENYLLYERTRDPLLHWAWCCSVSTIAHLKDSTAPATHGPT